MLVAASAVLLAASILHALTSVVMPANVDEDVKVSLADVDGKPLTGAWYHVDLYPGMAPAVTTFVVENTGERAAHYAIDLKNTGPTRAGGLSDRLVVDVRETVSGAVVYEGPLEQLHLQGASALAPGSVERYLMTTTWPPRSDDDRYQGSSTSFDLVVTAVPA